MGRWSDAHIRARLERALRQSVTDALWSHLVERGYVDDAIVKEDDAPVLTEARYMLRFASGMRRDRARRPAAAGDAAIRARARAEGAWVARTARGDRYRGMRTSWRADARDYLGPVLTPTEAVDRLTSPAWGLLPLGVLVGRDLTEGGRLGSGDAARIRGTRAAIVAQRLVRSGEGTRLAIDLVVAFDGVEEAHSILVPPTARRLTLQREDGPEVVVIAAPASLNERLLGLALNVQMAPMTAGEALWLILTDEASPTLPLTVEADLAQGGYPTISVRAAPWVPAAAVSAAFQEAQRHYRRGPSRPPRLRALEMARFLAEEGYGMTLSEQARAWSVLHPEWAVSDRGNFRSEALRSQRLVLEWIGGAVRPDG